MYVCLLTTLGARARRRKSTSYEEQSKGYDGVGWLGNSIVAKVEENRQD